MNRNDVVWIVVALSFSTLRGASARSEDNGPTPEDRANGYAYRLMTAESIKLQRYQYVVNLRGQIGLVYDMQRTGLNSFSGINGVTWRGRSRIQGEPFAIHVENSSKEAAYQGLQIAYDATGKDRSVTLQDQNHTATSWKFVRPKEEWFKKHYHISRVLIQLQATEGKFAGYFLDFGEPELVKVPDSGELKDRSYVRRQAILVKEPSELSVLDKLEQRER